MSFSITQHSLAQFEQKANEIIDRYYLTPYPKQPIKDKWQPCPQKNNLRDGHLERLYHGAMHVSRASFYIDFLHQLYQKYDQNYLHALSSVAACCDTDLQTLLMIAKYAALFHDSGRQDEGIDYWDRQSAENCVRYLQSNGIPIHLAHIAGAAIQHKGNPQAFYAKMKEINYTFNINISPAQADYLRQLVCNADVLDIIRVREKFELSYLDVYNKLNHIPTARTEIIDLCKKIGQVIFQQSDATMKCDIFENGKFVANATPKRNFSIQNKLQYEQAIDPYGKTCSVFLPDALPFNKAPTKDHPTPLTPLAGLNKAKNLTMEEKAKLLLVKDIHQFLKKKQP